ncbi:hypothetical protein ES711_12415 [Gelidibacter salicanalis]|uniref:Uncharacterized protein n=1 Tax=Gelidibacter salicanalis TaxID=291193 RepID=A0A5C7AEA5_9FLAO|nr:hypothetical protein [Gelidibacter salicanalis]TXE06751.1 hypothetical protein ES711_12415 [Gelidibacter salicanalis]
MDKKLVIRYAVLSILFFLPVAFLLMLLPAKHNYNALDIVKENVQDLQSDSDNALKDHITVLAFFGKDPLQNIIAASNLKELIYDKFKGFKKFQIIAVVSPEAKDNLDLLKKEIESHEDLKYWHFVFLSDDATKSLFNSLKTDRPLNSNLSTSRVFIVDMDLNQRGRLDDRTEREVETKVAAYDLTSYDCIEVAILKNKMSEDMRVLFTEYREKRKGNFDSTTRRANDLKGVTDEQED